MATKLLVHIYTKAAWILQVIDVQGSFDYIDVPLQHRKRVAYFSSDLSYMIVCQYLVTLAFWKE